ncbi:hypothetical protein KC640_02650, partial [Candidatus Dojkabacteria bacterium]|nr:hypothetical protein [Candidatus Dojkabacteria bacterium]
VPELAMFTKSIFTGREAYPELACLSAFGGTNHGPTWHLGTLALLSFCTFALLLFSSPAPDLLPNASHLPAF